MAALRAILCVVVGLLALNHVVALRDQSREKQLGSTTDDGPLEQRARRLTHDYLEKRVGNNIEGLKSFLTEKTTFNVDLKKTGAILANKVKGDFPPVTETIKGTDAVLAYYTAFPGEESDYPVPDAKNYECKKSTCIVTMHLERPVLGIMTDVVTFTWDETQPVITKLISALEDDEGIGNLASGVVGSLGKGLGKLFR